MLSWIGQWLEAIHITLRELLKVAQKIERNTRSGE